jgi:DMSO/TMAO reductase YedYZ heme-binding membrane subunit
MLRYTHLPEEMEIMIEKKGYLFIAAIISTMVVVFLIINFIDNSDPFDLLMRLGGLYGYFGICVSTMMTPYLKEITQTFGKKFIEVHHVTAVIGVACITLHPVIYAIQNLNLAVFLPVVSSWLDFWTMAGPPALMLLYVSLVAVILRMRIIKYWRYVHALMYVVLTFGIIHADMIQSDFAQSPILLALYNIFYVAVVFTFVLKRRERYLARIARVKLQQQRAE